MRLKLAMIRGYSGAYLLNSTLSIVFLGGDIHFHFTLDGKYDLKTFQLKRKTTK